MNCDLKLWARRLIRMALVLAVLLNVSTIWAQDSDKADSSAQTAARMLVISPFYSTSWPYADFDYLSRQLQLPMVFWQSYAREWDIYHLMDEIEPRNYKAALKPNRERAEQKLRELLDEPWAVIFWVRYDLPDWAQKKLAARVASGQPVVFLGYSALLKTKGACIDLLAQCVKVSFAEVGAVAHDYAALTQIKELNALSPGHKLLIFPRDNPYPESSIPGHDEVKLVSDFWREVVGKLIGRPLANPNASKADASRQSTVASSWPVDLSLTPDRTWSDYGQPVKLTVQAPELSTEYQGDNHLLIAVTDYTGRLLWQQHRPVEVAKVNETFTYTLENFGVNVYAYYVTAWLVHGEKIIGQAATTINHDKPWDMRRQWQWSAWESLYRQPSFHAAAMMNLFKDAGINSLGFGYPTTRSLWWANRYGWRKYGEVTGGRQLWNAPEITTANDEELRARVRAQMNGKFKQFGSSWTTAALSLASLGEEPGFSTAWGTTYYWKEDTAPPVAQQVFQQFLKGRYPDVAAVSESWQTPLKDWSDALLVRKYALKGPQFEPSQKLEDVPEDIRDFARYEDTGDFFNWYFKKVAGYATERLHEINPAVKTFYSLHGPEGVGEIGVAHNHHVYYPKEYQALEAARERLAHQGQPSFSLIWNHFEDQAVVTSGLWSQIANQVTHVDFWLGFPLMFNNDMTHTRASMAIKRLLTQFQPVSHVMAQAQIDNQGVAMLDGPFIGKRAASKIRSFQSAYTALTEAGFPPAFVDENTLSDAKLIFASGATHISPDLAQKLRQFVEQGGVLVTTAGFATRSQFGRLLPIAPGYGLDKWMGFGFGPNLSSDAPGFGMRPEGGPFKTHSQMLALDGIEMATSPHATQINQLADDVVVLGRFKDNTPALLYRKIGQGGVYHMNFLHQEWGWPTLVKPERESLERLIKGITSSSNIHPRFFIESLSPQLPEGYGMPFWGSQLFVGKDEKTCYLVVFNDHRSPIITGRIHWNQPGWQATDLLTQKSLAWTHSTEQGSYLDLSLLPGDGKILQLTPLGSTPEPTAVFKPIADAGQLPLGFTPVIPHGWPSETWPHYPVSDALFVTQLKALRSIYEMGDTRSDFSYFLFDANVQNRHAVTRSLAQQYWPDYVRTLEAALRTGGTFLLTGQDMGIDPASGLDASTHQPQVLQAIAALGQSAGAQWYSSSADGQMLTLSLGDGRLVLDRTNVDSIGFRNADYASWHEQWWPRIMHASDTASGAHVAGDELQPVGRLDASMLKQWLTGQWMAVPVVTINHFVDRQTQASITRYLQPVHQPQVISLAVPQGMVVQSAQFKLQAYSSMGFGNGGFEQADGNLPKGVRVYGKGALDESIKHSGEYALRLEPTEKNKTLITIVGLALGKRDENLVGKIYHLRVWAKAQNLKQLQFKIRAMQWGKPITWENDLWIPVGSLPKGTYDWQQFEFQVTLPDTRTNYVLFHIESQGDQDTKVWLDDMRGGKLPEHIQLNIAGDQERSLDLPLPADEGQLTVTQGLAQRINDYLPNAPIDLNGMRIVPLSLKINSTGIVRLSDLNLVLVKSSKP